MAINEELRVIVKAEAAAAIRELDRLKKTTTANTTAFAGMAKALVGIGGVTAALALTKRLVVDNISAGIRYAAALEKQAVAFEVLLGSQAKSAALMEDIRKFATSTPFRMADINMAAQRLLGYGSAAEEVVDTLRMLGDVAMGDTAILDRLSVAYGRLLEKGKASLESLNMFSEAGVPLMKELARQLEVTTERLYEMVSQGLVSFDDVDSALVSMTSEGGQFFQMVDKQAETLEGLMSTFKDSVEDLRLELVQGFIPAIKDALDWMIKLLRVRRESRDARESALSFGADVQHAFTSGFGLLPAEVQLARLEDIQRTAATLAPEGAIDSLFPGYEGIANSAAVKEALKDYFKASGPKKSPTSLAFQIQELMGSLRQQIADAATTATTTTATGGRGGGPQGRAPTPAALTERERWPWKVGPMAQKGHWLGRLPEANPGVAWGALRQQRWSMYQTDAPLREQQEAIKAAIESLGHRVVEVGDLVSPYWASQQLKDYPGVPSTGLKPGKIESLGGGFGQQFLDAVRSSLTRSRASSPKGMTQGGEAVPFPDLPDVEAIGDALRRSLKQVRVELKGVGKDLLEAFGGPAQDALRDFGRNIATGATGVEALKFSLESLGIALLDILPQLLIQAGLTLLPSPAGFALLVAGGLGHIAGGFVEGKVEQNREELRSERAAGESDTTINVYGDINDMDEFERKVNSVIARTRSSI